MATDTEPESVTVKARDIKPYHYGVWSVTRDEAGRESAPFSNTIVHIRWSDDGKHLWFGLDTHNAMKVEPDEEVEVIPERDPHTQRTRDRYASWVLPPPPRAKRATRYDHRYQWSASGPECDLCGFLHEPNLEPLEN